MNIIAFFVQEYNFYKLVSTSTHDHLLFFTNKGRVYRLKGYEIPEYGRTAKGLPVVNLLKLDEGESIQTIINVDSERSDDAYLFFTTRHGIVKRTSVKEFANIRQNGLKALNLKDEDELINVLLTEEDTDIIIGTKFGYAVRFNQSAVRGMSRIATGVRGVNLRDGDTVVGASVITDQDEDHSSQQHWLSSSLYHHDLLLDIQLQEYVYHNLFQ